MTHLELFLELALMLVLFMMHASFTTLATVLEEQKSTNAQLMLENAQFKITTRMLGIVPVLPA